MANVRANGKFSTMIRTYGLSHLALRVRNPDDSLQFYGKVFGFVEVYRGEDFIQAQIPETRDILVFKAHEKNAGRSAGIEHFGFRLISADDIEEAVQTVERAGGKILKSGEFVPGEPYVFFRDLDGYEVEVWYELQTPVDPPSSEPG